MRETTVHSWSSRASEVRHSLVDKSRISRDSVGPHLESGDMCIYIHTVYGLNA